MKDILSFLTGHFSDLMDLHVTVSIVILFILCVRQFLKGTPKIFSYALWGIVLLRLLVPVSIESSVSFVPERTEFSSMVELNQVLPEISFETPPDRTDDRHRPENDLPEEPTVQVSRSINAETYLTLVWLSGIVLMFLYSVISHWKLRRKVRFAVPLRKGIYITDGIDTPFVMGIFRPAIYLPGTLDGSQRRYIIAHERHHIRRGDHIFKALGFLALSIHWFNPLVWVAFTFASRDMEMSCDEAVIRKLGEAFRADYSETLLNLATDHRIMAGTPLAFGEDDPAGRVRNLAKWKQPKRWIILICVVLCTVLAVCLLTDPEISKRIESPQETAKTIKIVLDNEPLPDGYFESRDDRGNIIFTDGIHTIGGVVCYRIPEGAYDPDDHIETLLYRIGIPDYVNTSLYYRGGMTSGDNGWLAEFESDVPEGEEPTIYRRHHFYIVEDMVYDIWFDRILLDYETTEELRVCINLPEGKPTEMKEWNLSIRPERVSRTGATATFVWQTEQDVELTYGDFLALERYENGDWVPVEEQPGFEYFAGDSSYPVVDGYGMVHEWGVRFGQLPDGHYRLGKQVTLTETDGTKENRIIYGEFFLPDSILTGPIPLEELPETYSAEEAMIDGCFVTTDAVARENKEVFRNFAACSWNGVPGTVRIVNWHYGEDSSWSACDLSFDGNVYTLTTLENTFTFRYLKQFTGEKAWEGADHDGFDYYVLVNDDSVTFEDIMSGKLDMSDGKNPAHWTVYADFTYLPKRPQLPSNLQKAVLEFEGEELASTTDFDRLEKLWILFTDGEFLGYEPKTHSVGFGLNLILTTQDGKNVTIELDPDNDICRIDGEFVFYGAPDEPCYIEKLWYYLGIASWPDVVYDSCSNAFRIYGVG